MGFFAVTGGRVLSFRNLSVGETAALSLSKGMRRGQNSPMDKLLKRPASELGKSLSSLKNRRYAKLSLG